MKKPRITIYKVDDRYLGFSPDIQEYYVGLFSIKTIFKLLSVMYMCQKDENGMYLNLPLDKPIFTN